MEENLDRWYFESSSGTVVTDGDGYVIPEESDLDDYLLDIVRMDIEEMKSFAKSINNDFALDGEQDILACGFWSKDGSYEKADEGWRKEMYFIFDEDGVRIS